MYKPRLQRLEWVYADYPIFFLTMCTEGRRKILANNNTHEAFIRSTKGAAAWHVLPGRYVIMPDHIHLFAAFGPDSISLSAWIKAMKSALSAEFRKSALLPPSWQKGLFDHLLRSAESYEQKWEYVRDNPVRAGLVAKHVDWPYQGEIHPLILGQL